ncbi:hypothetical protein GGX14DRAFT_423539 [Mycena pura]|uniref:Carbohydrate-binding module family 19 domain-containing protein n=1 Tax=Mycena pura TaxID=153505 RepID=A0AAD7E3Z4_9AGAR|nr:hypothetical protein GGX14DRAFT_423539 [Mycena pura]
MYTSAIIALALALSASARPARFQRRAAFTLANGQQAIKENASFKTLTASSSCTAGQDACVTGQFAQCVNGKFVLQPCAGGTVCASLPLDNKPGTSITCDTQADVDARIAAVGPRHATGATDAGAGSGASAAAPPASGTAPDSSAAAAATSAAAPPPANDAGAAAAAAPPVSTFGAPPSAAALALQTSLTLDPSVVCSGFSDDGQNPPVAGQSASSTSTNNYINFCALTLPSLPLTNGAQVTTGSCNPAPIGQIPSVDNMPSAKFNFPKNGDSINANVPFNATLNIQGIQTGVFTNAQKTYFAAPQTLNAQGQIVGHTHIVIETLSSLDQITPTDPKKFFFFKGVDAPAQDGIAAALVTTGVPAGAYRICSINSSSNHQPVIVPIAQHGSLDDCSYFTAK